MFSLPATRVLMPDMAEPASVLYALPTSVVMEAMDLPYSSLPRAASTCADSEPVAFFTLVPAGRAIAKGIFDYVIGVSGGQLEIEQREEKALYESRGYVKAGEVTFRKGLFYLYEKQLS